LLLRKSLQKNIFERIKLGENTLRVRGLGAHFMKGLINVHKIFIEKWL